MDEHDRGCHLQTQYFILASSLSMASRPPMLGTAPAVRLTGKSAVLTSVFPLGNDAFTDTPLTVTVFIYDPSFYLCLGQ